MHLIRTTPSEAFETSLALHYNFRETSETVKNFRNYLSRMIDFLDRRLPYELQIYSPQTNMDQMFKGTIAFKKNPINGRKKDK